MGEAPPVLGVHRKFGEVEVQDGSPLGPRLIRTYNPEGGP